MPSDMMKKRFISVLLALCLVISLLPVSALAEEAPQTSAEETVTEPAAEGSGSAPAGTAAPFHQSEDIGGVTITVDADAGVFPADAKLSAAMIVDESDIAQIEDAVEAEAGVPSEQSFTFDIRVLDADGNELQPDPDKGEVRVSFASDAIAEAAEDEDMQAAMFVFYAALAAICYLWTSYAYYWVSGRPPVKKAKRWFAAAPFIEFFLLLVNLFTGIFYTVSPDGVYARGGLFAAYIGFSYFFLICAIVATVLSPAGRKNQTKRQDRGMGSNQVLCDALKSGWLTACSTQDPVEEAKLAVTTLYDVLQGTATPGWTKLPTPVATPDTVDQFNWF